MRAADLAAADLEFFEKQVRPLLIANCYQCHSAEERIRGGLRLDTRDGWATGGDSGPAIDLENPSGSLLLRAVHRTDEDFQMPPEEPLSAAEVAVLEEWIARGAPDPRTGRSPVAVSALPGGDVWSLKPAERHGAPAVKQDDWPRNDIDHFLLARMEDAGLEPSEPAPPHILLRRLSYALTGLPPAEEDLDAFLADPSPEHYERMVDQYLASPQFGERWGRHWLDITRFAESSGGGRTLPFRDAWRFRDYVIESINDDRPLDQMVREHIAGDLLAAEVKEDVEEQRRRLVATSFLALGPTNYEEQDKQQLRWDIIDEQLDTFGKAFLGLSLSCARCHDHKFDPVTARDYYAMAGMFASVRTLRNLTDNVAHWVDADLPLDADTAAALEEKDQQLAGLRGRIRDLRGQLEDKPDAAARGSIDPASLPGVVLDDVEATKVGEWIESTYSNHFVGPHALHDDNSGKGSKSVAFTTRLPADGDYEVRFSYVPGNNRSNRTPATIYFDGGKEEIQINQRETPPIDGRFISLGTYPFSADADASVVIANAGTNGHVSVDAVQWLPVGDTPAAGDEELAETEEDQADAEAAREAIEKQIAELEEEVKEVQSRPPFRGRYMTVAEHEPGDVPIAIRGDYAQPGAVVARGFPAAFTWWDEEPLISDPEQSGRAELAEWMTDPRNPLTSRVLVNRVWHWLFDAGLVRSVDNFGATGDEPTHPELLDTLAVGFVDSGWSLKQLVREIVLSAAWQQSSESRSDIDAIDPDNLLLARMPLRRMDAEALRDTMLLVSGRLDLTTGGSPLAATGEADANSTATQNMEYNWKYDDTRRTVYSPGFRTNRFDFLLTFNGADPNVVTGARHISTTPPQALYLMNHPLVLEHAASAGERALEWQHAGANGSDNGRAAEEAATIDAALTRLWRSALSRPPSDTERELLRDHIAAAGDDRDARRQAWADVVQILYASIDFRHIH